MVEQLSAQRSLTIATTQSLRECLVDGGGCPRAPIASLSPQPRLNGGGGAMELESSKLWKDRMVTGLNIDWDFVLQNTLLFFLVVIDTAWYSACKEDSFCAHWPGCYAVAESINSVIMYGIYTEKGRPWFEMHNIYIGRIIYKHHHSPRQGQSEVNNSKMTGLGNLSCHCIL